MSTPQFNVSEISHITSASTNTTYGFCSDSDGTNIIIGSYSTGKAFIYSYDGTTWNQDIEITKTSRFGYKVAIEGEWAAITSYPINNTNGFVVMYRKVSGTWTEHSTLNAPVEPVGGTDTGGFGASVDLSGTTMVVGRTQGTGTYAGGVHVYVWNGTSWVVQGNFIGYTSATAGYKLGQSVSIDGDILVSGGSAGVVPEFQSGRVLVSKRTGTTWSTPVVISAPNSDYGFGWAVRVKGTEMIVTAPDFGSGTASTYGRVYLYDISGSTPVLSQTFKIGASEIISDPLGGTTTDGYGWDANFDSTGNVMAVGAIGRNGTRGIVYLYEKVDGVWSQSATPNSWLIASNATANARFGSSITFAQGGLMVGAYLAKTIYWFK